MKKQLIIRKTRRYYRKLQLAFKQMKRTYDKEAIHQFRLSYKRLNAFLRMIASKKSNKDLVMPLKLKKIYKHTGTLRALQLQVSAFEGVSNSTATPYLEKLQSSMQKASEQLRKQLHGKRLNKYHDENLSSVKECFGSNDYILFIEGKLAGLSDSVNQKQVSCDALHAVRRVLKDLFYTQKVFIERNQLASNWWNTHADSCKVLIDELGIFNDQRDIADHLGNGNVSQLGKAAQEWMQDEHRNRVNEMNKTKEIIVKKLQTEFPGAVKSAVRN
jgi:CHAD domain-containing protein